MRGETRFGIVERKVSSYMKVSGLLELMLMVGVMRWRTWVWSFSRRARESSRDCTVSAMAISVSE